LILIVDDDRVQGRALELFAEQCGMKAVLVDSGEEALKRFSSDSADYRAVVMDWKLPGIDGLECTRQLRKLENSSESAIPIIGITGYAPLLSKDQCLAAGMNDYLVKPITLEQFKIMVNLYIDQGPSD